MAMSTKNWVFTIQLSQDEDGCYDVEIPRRWPSVQYAVWQLEVAKTGQHHLQGYVVFSGTKTLVQVKKVDDKAHWEPRKGTHTEARDYCQKEETREDGPWEVGKPPIDKGTGKGSTVMAMKDGIDAGMTEKELWAEYFGMMSHMSRAMREYRMITQPPRAWQTRLEVYWGPPGTGKSVRARNRGGDEAYWLRKPSPGGQIWFDGYTGQKSVIIDEFYGWIPIDLWCRMVDRYPLLVDTKGGAVSFCARRIIITSNVAPSSWWKKAQDGGPIWAAVQRRLQPPVGTVVYTGEDRRVVNVEDLEVEDAWHTHGETVGLSREQSDWQALPVVKKESNARKRKREDEEAVGPSQTQILEDEDVACGCSQSNDPEDECHTVGCPRGKCSPSEYDYP